MQANLGLRYLDLDDLEAARVALEHALAEYQRARGEDAVTVSYFIVPLIRVCRRLGEVELALRYADRALAANLLDGSEWDADFLDTLLEVADDRVDDEQFDHLVNLARELTERRLTPSDGLA